MPVFDKIAQHLRRKGETPIPAKPGDYFGWRLTDGKQPFAIHLRAEKAWELKGFDTAGGMVRIPLPAGEFTLDFPMHSVNLSVAVIDPDPGGGGLVE
jgi:hypothetical protein